MGQQGFHQEAAEAGLGRGPVPCCAEWPWVGTQGPGKERRPEALWLESEGGGRWPRSL